MGPERRMEACMGEREELQKQEMVCQGEKIILRRMEEADTHHIVAWRNNPRVRACFIYRKEFTPQGHQGWIRDQIEPGHARQWILCEKSSGTPVGSVYFRDIDRKKKEAEYGIFIGEDRAAGKGYGTEAARLAVSCGFCEMGLERIILRVFTDNTAALRSYEAAGFRIVEFLPAVECSDGEKKDMLLMELHKKDWELQRTAGIQSKKESGDRFQGAGSTEGESGTESQGNLDLDAGSCMVSYVIPCYRSAQTLPAVVEEIRQTMELLKQEGKKYLYEIILVNDCSPDDTFSVIRKLRSADPSRIRGINLAKNFGQHAALMAGFQLVKGDIILCLDDDGQTPADEAGKLLAAIEEGMDVVYAKYEHKQHSLFRNFGSYMNEEMARIMLGKPRDLYVSSYFAARRFVIEDMKKYTNAYPYVIGLVLRAAGRIGNVTVCHREREVGTSGYTLRKLLALWFNGFTAFSVKPLRVATAVGCTCSGAGFLYGIYTIIKKLVNPAVPLGFSSLMAATVFMGGMTMIMLGLVGEYVGRMYISMNNSPQYVIREIVGEQDSSCSFVRKDQGDQK